MGKGARGHLLKSTWTDLPHFSSKEVDRRIFLKICERTENFRVKMEEKQMNDLKAPKIRSLRKSLQKGDLSLKLFHGWELSCSEVSTMPKIRIDELAPENNPFIEGEDKLKDLHRAIDSKVGIPTPEIIMIDQKRYNHNYPETFTTGLPENLVKCKDEDSEDDRSGISDEENGDSDYDMDSDDERWIDGQKNFKMEPDTFEKIIRRLNQISVLSQTHPAFLKAKNCESMSLVSEEELNAVFSYWVENRRKYGSLSVRNPRGPSRHTNRSLHKPYRAFRPPLPAVEPKVLRSHKKDELQTKCDEIKRARLQLQIMKRDMKYKCEVLKETQDRLLSLEMFWKRENKLASKEMKLQETVSESISRENHKASSVAAGGSEDSTVATVASSGSSTSTPAA